MSTHNNPTIQRPKWAITTLIHNTIGTGRQARRDLIGRLGFANKGKAAQRYDQMLRTGDINPLIRQTLPAALGVDPAAINQACAQTAAQQTEYAQRLAAWQTARERRLFKPHIQIKMDIRQAKFGITVLCFVDTPELRRIEVPAGVPSLPKKVQLAWVRGLIDGFPDTCHGRRYDALYAQPTGYIYCPRFDEAWVLSRELALVCKVQGGIRAGGFEARVGGRMKIPLSLG